MLTAWTELLRRVAPDADPSAVAAAGTDLLRRYAEPVRRYHDGRHLAEVLAAVDAIASGPAGEQPGSEEGTGAGADLDAVRLATWFHDAVYDPRAAAGANERASAALATATLAGLGLPAGLVDRVAALVWMTADHDVAGADPDAQVLSDADLAILASPADRYRDYAAAVRREYAHVPDPAFRAGRAAILAGFVARPRIYATGPAYAAWEAPARANLAAELASLTNPDTDPDTDPVTDPATERLSAPDKP